MKLENMKTIIVTRHKGAKDWIQKHHPELVADLCQMCAGQMGCHQIPGHCDVADGQEVHYDVEIVAHATPEILVGNHVVGVLPINLAALCAEYWHLEMNVPAEARGKELTCEDMEKFGCTVTRYEVKKVESCSQTVHRKAMELFNAGWRLHDWTSQVTDTEIEVLLRFPDGHHCKRWSDGANRHTEEVYEILGLDRDDDEYEEILVELSRISGPYYR